jgi:hypothetical protein
LFFATPPEVSTAFTISKPHFLDRAANPPSELARIDFDIVDAHRALATLGLHYQRLSRQFQKTLDSIREIQSERRRDEERQLKQAVAFREIHKHKGIPCDPAQHGFLFQKTGSKPSPNA